MTIIEQIHYADAQFRIAVQESHAWDELRQALKKEYRKTGECLHDAGRYFNQDNSRDGWSSYECALCGALDYGSGYQ